LKLAQALTELKRRGTAQNRKIYRRHGVSGPLDGVSYAHLGELKKAIKTDHELAHQLWETGRHDARVLATMVADPAAAKVGLVNGWVRDIDNYVLSDAVASYVARTPIAVGRLEKWTRAKGEWTGRVGWLLVAHLARDAAALSDGDLVQRIGEIERRILSAPNRTRDAMNSALIAIGLRSQGFKKRAQAAARRIGRVEVDHGETGCMTPDAVAYIDKAWARRRKKQTQNSPRGRRKRTAAKPSS
jgi:3-methyladenine DNA glycosylase AlkD